MKSARSRRLVRTASPQPCPSDASTCAPAIMSAASATATLATVTFAATFSTQTLAPRYPHQATRHSSSLWRPLLPADGRSGEERRRKKPTSTHIPIPISMARPATMDGFSPRPPLQSGVSVEDDGLVDTKCCACRWQTFVAAHLITYLDPAHKVSHGDGHALERRAPAQRRRTAAIRVTGNAAAGGSWIMDVEHVISDQQSV